MPLLYATPVVEINVKSRYTLNTDNQNYGREGPTAQMSDATDSKDQVWGQKLLCLWVQIERSP